MMPKKTDVKTSGQQNEKETQRQERCQSENNVQSVLF